MDHKMLRVFSTVFLLFSHLFDNSLTGAKSTPRMMFTEEDSAVKRMTLPPHQTPVRILPDKQPDRVTVVGQRSLYSYNFQQQKYVEKTMVWPNCEDCNIALVHEKKEANQLFLCGDTGNNREMQCCNLNLSEQTLNCNKDENIKPLSLKESEPSVLVETPDGTYLFIAYSGSEENVGIHKIGNMGVGPTGHDKEHHYVGMISNERNDPSQNRVYAFYKEKNIDTDPKSDMWIPFVTQVCQSDTGGSKNYMQFLWTSQMNARLYCGEPKSRRHFPELVDVATVQADKWQDTRIYALFRNEWGMSAVCVYTLQDIDHIFKNSQFKGSRKGTRSRTCEPDSSKISLEILQSISQESEMQDSVQPVNRSGPLLFNHHNYTRIYVDSSPQKRNGDNTVLFLSLNNGAIHKVIQTGSHSVLIVEYHPFNHSHILGTALHLPSRKLYVTSASELVQLDVADCAKYGNSCQDCVLARDPYCGWRDDKCVPGGKVQDVANGNHTICHPDHQPAHRYSSDRRTHQDAEEITVPSGSRFYLQCQMLSQNAKYTWKHNKNSITCTMKNQNCLYLIDNMGPKQEGTYQCVSEELGYTKVRAEYSLQLRSRAAGPYSSPLLWVCLIIALITILSQQS